MHRMNFAQRINDVSDNTSKPTNPALLFLATMISVIWMLETIRGFAGL
jgi:hypothetical protein